MCWTAGWRPWICFVLGSLWLVASCVRDSRDLNAARGERAVRPSGVRAQSWPVCSLIGPRTATPGIYGTDLGFTARTEHSDKLAILFGDTWTRPASGCEYPTVPSDDLQAFLPRARPAALRPGPPPARQPVRCDLLEVPRSASDDPTTKCLGGEVVHAVQDQLSGNPIGRLYGVNVIDEWTEDLGDGEAEIYWNASTWNPYQVVLIKTRLSARARARDLLRGAAAPTR
jgi:hypothetical protein